MCLRRVQGITTIIGMMRRKVGKRTVDISKEPMKAPFFIRYS